MSGPKDKKYSVGYGKPPSQSRLVKGKSGNPKGRPRKVNPSRDLTEIERLMQEPTTRAVINGRQREITAAEFLYRRQAQSALAGDVKAAAALLIREITLMKRKAREKHSRTQEKELSGYMLVPSIPSIDEWEAIAIPSQQELVRLTQEEL